MPTSNPEIITGARAPQQTGRNVTKPHEPAIRIDTIRRVQLREDQVEFHSEARRYRVEFQKPKAQLDISTGESVEEGARFLQFDDQRCVTDNPTLIHQAKGCKNIPGAMICVEHEGRCENNKEQCPRNRGSKCSMGHVNPKNASQKYFPTHVSYGIGQAFWDASEMAAKVKAESRRRQLDTLREMAQNPPEDLPEEAKAQLASLNLDHFPMGDAPKQEKTA